MADLLLLLLRHTLEHRPGELALYVGDAIRSEMSAMADTIASLEARIVTLEGRP